MTHSKLVVVAAFAAGVGLSARPASAYVRTQTDRGTPVRWSSTCLYITTHFDDPPANLTTDLAMSAAREAAAAWSRPGLACTDLELHISTSTAPDADVANDGHSNVVFREGEWCRIPRDPSEPCYDGQALAITTVFALQNSGQILDADTEINAVNFTWADLVARIGVMGIRVADLQNTLTHEFGHFIGLDHNCHSAADKRHGVDQNGFLVPECLQASPEVAAATMFNAVQPGDVERRTLAQDDMDGACTIYPAQGAAACPDLTDPDPSVQVAAPPAQDNGCAVSPGRRPTRAGLTLLVIPALFWLRLRRRLSARRPG